MKRPQFSVGRIFGYFLSAQKVTIEKECWFPITIYYIRERSGMTVKQVPAFAGITIN
jgi:hypothetical protein